MTLRPRAARLLVGVVAVAIATPLAWSLLRGSAPPPPSPSPSTATIRPVPPLSSVYVIVLENQGYGDIVGNPDAPVVNALIAQHGIAEDYRGVTHPSQPNYLALVSGSTQGVTDNEPHDITAPTLFDQLEAAGRSWRVYAENVPPDCFRGATADGGRDGPGTYVRRHEPAISFTGISGDAARCANIQDLAAFDPVAADLELVIPNLCHDMHDCDVATGDAWLGAFLPRIAGSPAFGPDALLVVTFDESRNGSGEDERVVTVVVPGGHASVVRSGAPHDHLSLLRTIQDGFGLPCLAESCTAGTLGEFFAGSDRGAVASRSGIR